VGHQVILGVFLVVTSFASRAVLAREDLLIEQRLRNDQGKAL
jgi:hypothetical protein